MKRIITAVAPLAVTAALSGCSDETINRGIASGSIEPLIMVDVTVAPGGDVEVPDGIVPVPDDSAYRFFVTDAAGNTAPWSFNPVSGVAQRLLPGTYGIKAVAGTIGSEGFDTPCLVADTTVTVADDLTTCIVMVARLAQTVVNLDFDPSMTEAFTSVSATLHSRDGHYCQYTPGDTGPMYLRPGDVTLSLSIGLDDSTDVSFNILELPEAANSTYYDITLTTGEDAGVPAVTATASSGQRAKVLLTQSFVNAPEPELTSSGFVSGETIPLVEGETPSEPLTAHVASADLRHLFFTGIAPTLGQSITAEMDLLALSQADRDSLAAYGIICSGLTPGRVKDGIVDLTRVVSHLRYVPDAIPSTFSLRAVDGSGRVSRPLVLSVDVKSMDISLVSVSPAVIGIDKAQATFRASSPVLMDNITLEAYDKGSRSWQRLEVTAVDPGKTDNEWIVTFTLPEGLEPVDARMIYCDKERATFAVTRKAPDYALAVDAFALHAAVAVEAQDSAMTGIVTSSLQFYDTAGKLIRLVERDPARGMVYVSGLDADTHYTLRTTLVPDPTEADFGHALSFRTESASQLPNSDFEDVKYRALVYKDVLSGGRYSQNTVEIYNRQNRTSFEHHMPERWANVNAKTFCTAATDHNTWYLAPSTYTVTDAYSGAYAVRLDCVGYDIDGEPIPDYRQTSEPYTDYSRNSPDSYSRAAGRLFLGSYSFDPVTGLEQYDEGHGFTSRPLALNGFYKFMPTAENPRASGLARIEIIGKPDGAEVVLAGGEMLLPPALSYTAFSIPLTYNRFGEKATSIRIMFAPSYDIGDIESETANVIVIPLLPSATLRGSSLWIDNLSLSY